MSRNRHRHDEMLDKWLAYVEEIRRESLRAVQQKRQAELQARLDAIRPEFDRLRHSLRSDRRAA
jgi:hypothetical protein